MAQGDMTKKVVCDKIEVVNTWNIQLQGNLAEMQQYMSLFQTLKADYMAGIQMLVSGGMPKAQQQARR